MIKPSKMAVSAVTSFYVDKVGPLFDYMMFRLPPGPRCVPLCWVINFFKGATLPWCFFLMYYFNNWSHTAYTIAATHGSYGVLWCIKHFVIPDAYWFEKATIPSVLLVDAPVLAAYWSASYFIISSGIDAPPHRTFVSTFMYVIGVVLMLVADTQKYFVLRVKKGLISDGWFSTIRNTNYLGEMLLYGSFALLAGRIEPMYVYGGIWMSLFAGRWAAKDQSFSKKAGGKAYMNRSDLVFPTQWWALAAYVALGYYLYYIY